MKIPFPLENPLAFKAIAYDERQGYFYSPSRHSFHWNSPLVTATCTRSEYADHTPILPEHNHVAGGKNCWCGIHCTYRVDIALEYTEQPINPVFLLEASGTFQLHTMGFRAQQVLVRYAVKPSWGANGATERATIIGADRFGVPILTLEEATLFMDLWNFQLFPQYYQIQTPELQGLTKETLIEIYNSIYSF